MAVVNGVTFPDVWIPATALTPTTVLHDIGTDLLTVAAAALDLYGYGARYVRTYVGDGSQAVIEQSKAGQLTVLLTEFYLGEAGRKQFLPPQGSPGRFAHESADYLISIAQPAPTRPQGRPPASPDLDSSAAVLQRDSYIVFEAMRSLALGGVIAPTGRPLQLRQQEGNQLHVGGLTPNQTRGGQASYQLPVTVQI